MSDWFVSEFCLKKLGIDEIKVNLSLFTLSIVNTVVSSTKASGLHIQGYYSRSICFILSGFYSC